MIVFESIVLIEVFELSGCVFINKIEEGYLGVCF